MEPGNGSAISYDNTARESWDAERTTFQRVYDVLVGVHEATSVAQFARWADCSETGARSALEQLTETGIAQRREGRPAEYRRNDSFPLATDRSARARASPPRNYVEASRTSLSETTNYGEKSGVPGPEAVTGDELVADDHEQLHEIRDDLTEWRTVRRDIGMLRRAERRADARDADGVSA
jgi:hypothetical protein